MPSDVYLSNGVQLGFHLPLGTVISVEQVEAALRGIRAPLITQETDLHGLVAQRLDEAGIPFRREVEIGPRDRIDILVAGGIGVECKKGKPNRTALLAQIGRYADCDKVAALIVVVPWKRHLHLPGQLEGKPVRVVSLNRLWGVAI